MYDEFVEKAKARALKRNVGDPFKSGIEQGPQVVIPSFRNRSLTMLSVINRTTFQLVLEQKNR